jgi:hypothetical protein
MSEAKTEKPPRPEPAAFELLLDSAKERGIVAAPKKEKVDENAKRG